MGKFARDNVDVTEGPRLITEILTAVAIFQANTVSAHLEKDMKGAEFWLQHVMSEHAKIQEKQRDDERLRKGTPADGAATKTKENGKGKGKGKKH